MSQSSDKQKIDQVNIMDSLSQPDHNSTQLDSELGVLAFESAHAMHPLGGGYPRAGRNPAWKRNLYKQSETTI